MKRENTHTEILSSKPDRGRWLWPLLVFLVGAAIYANTLGCGFTWDDEWLILDNPRIDDPSYIKYMLFERTLWRPVKRISLMLDYHLHGEERPGGYHATNILLHALVCLVLYFVVLRLGKSRRLAGVTALLFAVHPVHVESIANISHRKEPFALLFFLLAFLCYLRAAEKSSAGSTGALSLPVVLNLIPVYLFYMLGMLSKEVGAVMLPAVIIVYELAVAREPWPQRKQRAMVFMAPFLVPLAIFVFFGYLGSLPGRFSEEEILWITARQTTSYGPVLLGAIKSFGILGWMCIWPWPLYLDRVFDMPKGPFELQVVAGLLAVLLFTLGLWLARRRGNRLAVFALAWYGLNLLPVINVIPLTHWWVPERFMYVPSVGFSLLVALGLEWLWSRKGLVVAGQPASRLATGMLAVILVTHGALTIKQNMFWENSKVLWENTLRYNKDRSYRALYGYGLELYNAGDYAGAEPMYRRAMKVNPSYPEVRYGLALMLLYKEEYDEAMEQARIYAKLDKRDPEPFIIIGNAEFHRRNFDEAIEAYATAVERKPEHCNGWYNLGNAQYAAGRLEEAAESLKKTMGRCANKDSLMLYGSVLTRLSRFEEALTAYREAVRLDPQSASAANGQAGVLFRMKRYPAAAREIERSLRLNPDQAQVKRLLQQIKKKIREQDD